MWFGAVGEINWEIRLPTLKRLDIGARSSLTNVPFVAIVFEDDNGAVQA
jgi:hypothetical protein